jgi:hypothetical protein
MQKILKQFFLKIRHIYPILAFNKTNKSINILVLNGKCELNDIYLTNSGKEAANTSISPGKVKNDGRMTPNAVTNYIATRTLKIPPDQLFL